MRTLLDLLPLLAFFVTAKFYGIVTATLVLVVLSVVAVIVLYCLERKIAMVPMVSVVIVTVFGGLTILFDDPIFIKLKPTILNVIFALALFIGNYLGKPVLILFLVLALLNEIVRRNFSDEVWLNFKVFGIIGITIIFVFTQMPFMAKQQKQLNH
jgi:intracellular septation protein